MPVPRDALGRILPGHTLNKAGRPKGYLADTRKPGAQLAARDFLRRVQRLQKIADSDDDYAAMQAIRELNLLGMRAPEGGAKAPLTCWMNEKRRRVFNKLMSDARRLRDSGAPMLYDPLSEPLPEQQNAPIDIAAEVIDDGLPAPRVVAEAQAPQPDDAQEYEDFEGDEE